MNFFDRIISCHGMGEMMNHIGWFGYGGGIMMILILIVVAFVIYLLVKNSSKYGTSVHEDAVDILKKRYAKGEISKAEFDTMKLELK